MITPALSHPIVIAAIIAQIGAIVLVVLTMRQSNKQASDKRIEAKRDIEDCVAFRTRIGNESQEHFNTSRRIERALVFLVTRAGGDPSQLDLR